MCDVKIINASGKTFEVCVAYSITQFGKIYSWASSYPVLGGTLIRIDNFDRTFYYVFVVASNGNGDDENGGNGDGRNGDAKSGCDNKNISASGRTFSYCIPYTITEFGKVYSYPLKMKVSGGTLNRYDIGTGFGYTFTPTVVDTENGNGSGNGNDEIITGVDNTFLIVGAIALFLMMKS